MIIGTLNKSVKTIKMIPIIRIYPCSCFSQKDKIPIIAKIIPVMKANPISGLSMSIYFIPEVVIPIRMNAPIKIRIPPTGANKLFLPDFEFPMY